MIVQIRKADLMKNQPITPGWYKGKVVKIGKTEASGDRIDQPIEVNFEDPLLRQDDRTLEHTFYNALTKGIGFVVSFAAAIKRMPVKTIADQLESGAAFDFDFEKCLGEDIQFKVINDTYQGRIVNKIDGFLPYDATPIV